MTATGPAFRQPPRLVATLCDCRGTRGRLRIASWLMLGLCAVWSTGCPSTASNNYSEVRIDARHIIQSTSLGAGDEIEVRVYEEPALSGSFVISPAGQIDYPLVGTITVEGLAAAQVGELLRKRLKQGFLRNPYVVVQVKSLSSKKVFVLGEVRTPGRLQFTDRMTIVEAITLAGGFSPVAEKNFTIVTRAEPTGQRRIPVPVEKIMQGLAVNFAVQPGDIIYVPETVL